MKLDEIMTFAEATEALGKSSSYLNNMVATNKLVEGYHFRKAGRVRLVKASVVEEIKNGVFTGNGLIGAKWGELTKDLQETLLSKANYVDGSGNNARKGKCIVDLTETLSIAGELVGDEIVIDDEAEIYTPAP